MYRKLLHTKIIYMKCIIYKAFISLSILNYEISPILDKNFSPMRLANRLVHAILRILCPLLTDDHITTIGGGEGAIKTGAWLSND